MPARGTTMSTKTSHIDNQVLTFGKYNGHVVGDVAEEDPSYIVWLYENVDNAPNMTGKWCSKALYDACYEDHTEEAHDWLNEFPGYFTDDF